MRANHIIECGVGCRVPLAARMVGSHLAPALHGIGSACRRVGDLIGRGLATGTNSYATQRLRGRRLPSPVAEKEATRSGYRRGQVGES